MILEAHLRDFEWFLKRLCMLLSDSHNIQCMFDVVVGTMDVLCDG